MPTRGYSRGGAAVAQTEAADTSADPVTVTLPVLAGLDNGYIVRVYDSGSNASVNNITINDADDVEVDTITEADGERYLVVVGGAWEVRGYLPGPSGGTPAALVQLAALYTQAVASGATNTIPRFEDGQVRLPVAGVSEAWIATRAADRYVEAIVKTPDVASPTGTLVLWGLNTDCVGRVISVGTDWVWVRSSGGSALTLGSHADWRNKTVYISTFYDFSAQAFTHRVRAEGLAEVTAAGTQASTLGFTPDYVALGGNVSSYVSTPGMQGIWAALYAADPGDAHRAAMYAAAGIT